MHPARLRNLLLIAVCVLQAAVPALAGSRSQPLHVLLLYSYERDFAPHGQIAAEFQKELNRRSDRPINYFDVSLQPARASRSPEDEPTLQYLLSTFAGQRLDLIVSFGG